MKKEDPCFKSTCTPLAFFLWYTPTATEVHKISRCLPLTDSPLFLPELPGKQTLWTMTTTPLRDLPQPRPPHSLSPSHVHSLCTLAVVRGASANIILQGQAMGHMHLSSLEVSSWNQLPDSRLLFTMLCVSYQKVNDPFTLFRLWLIIINTSGVTIFSDQCFKT